MPPAIGGHLEAVFKEGDSQLSKIAFQSGRDLYRRCPYQASVIKMLLAMSSSTVVMAIHRIVPAPAVVAGQCARADSRDGR
jgi:hypothetical protein